MGLFDGDRPIDYFARGEVFGIAAIGGHPYLLEAKAVQDTVCYLFTGETFKEVLDRNDRFSSFFLSFAGRRFRSFKDIADRGEVLQETAYISHIDQALYKDPVICGSDTIVEKAVSLMDRNRVNSVVVVNGGLEPIGIFTHKDLRRAVLGVRAIQPGFPVHVLPGTNQASRCNSDRRFDADDPIGHKSSRHN